MDLSVCIISFLNDLFSKHQPNSCSYCETYSYNDYSRQDNFHFIHDYSICLILYKKDILLKKFRINEENIILKKLMKYSEYVDRKNLKFRY